MAASSIVDSGEVFQVRFHWPRLQAVALNIELWALIAIGLHLLARAAR